MKELPYQLPEYVSPSSLSTYNQCPLKYKYSRVNKIAEPPTQATLLGNFVHDVLESFYGQLLPEERTVSSLRSLSTSTWADGEWESRISGIVADGDKHGFRWNAWWCLENIFKVENPPMVPVGGVETELNGTIQHVPLKGFVDRWFDLNGEVRISDYKTGKTPREPYVDDKFVQLLIYALVLSDQLSTKVTDVELLYLKDGKKFIRKVTDQMLDSVSEMVVNTYDQIVASFNDNEWPARPSKLCYWCHYKDTICEYWRNNKS